MRYGKEEYKYSGRFKLTNLADGDSYGGSYSIGFWIEGECKMTMTFIDFAISSIDGLGEYRQGMLMMDFDEMIEYLIYKSSLCLGWVFQGKWPVVPFSK